MRHFSGRGAWFVWLKALFFPIANRHARRAAQVRRRSSKRNDFAAEALEMRRLFTATVSVELLDPTSEFWESEVIGTSFRIDRGTVDLSSSLTVNFSLTGTAVRGTDYDLYLGSSEVPTATSISFAANQRYANLSLRPMLDNLAEGTETVIFQLQSGTGYVRQSGESRIDFEVHNTPAKVSVLAPSPSSVAENSAAGTTFRIQRADNLIGNLTVNFAMSGTATRGSSADYVLRYGGNVITGNSITMTNGQDEAVLTLDPILDDDGESSETAILTLGSGTNYTIVGSGSSVATITNTPAQVSVLAPSPASVPENSSAGTTFRIERGTNTVGDLVVNFAMSGSATRGSSADYVLRYGGVVITGNSITLANGQNEAVITLDPILDGAAEGNETAVLTLASGTNYTIVSGSGTATATITNTPAQVSVLAPDPATIPENSSAGTTFRIQRGTNTVGDLVVNFAMSGTAIRGATQDYVLRYEGEIVEGDSITMTNGQTEAVLTLDPRLDGVAEGNETVVLTLASGMNYAIVGGSGSVTATIANTPAQVSVLAPNPAAVAENSTGTTFRLQRATNLTNDFVVNFAISGTATRGTDYVLRYDGVVVTGDSITMADGQTEAVIEVVPLTDELVESSETVVLTLAAGTNYTIVGGFGAATATISNVPVGSVTVPGLSVVAENDANGASFRLSRAGNGTSALVVKFTIGGTATRGSDYVLKVGSSEISPDGNAVFSVTIPANENSVDVLADPILDDVAESDETVVLTLVQDEAYVIDGDADDATITIQNTPAIVGLSAGVVTRVRENVVAGTSFVVTRGDNLVGNLTIGFSVAGSATRGTDYVLRHQGQTLTGNSIVLADGVGEATIQVVPMLDGTTEGDETIVLSLVAGTNHTIDALAPAATVTIEDTLAEVGVVAANDDPVAEGQTASAKFVIERGVNLEDPLVVKFRLAGESTHASDYSVKYGGQTLTPDTNGVYSVEFVNGQDEAEISLVANLDGSIEGLETVVLTLEEDANYVVSSSADEATAEIDDTLPEFSISAAPPAEVAEGEANGAAFTISRGDNLIGPATVRFTLAGAATAGTDYVVQHLGQTLLANLDGEYEIEFAEDQTEASIAVVATIDGVTEGDESVTLALVADDSYTVDSSADEASVALQDTLAEVSIAADRGAIREQSTASTVLTIRRSGVLLGDVTVHLASTGGAVLGEDFRLCRGGVELTTLAVTIEEGETEAEITLVLLNDANSESAEKATLTIQSDDDYTIDSAASAASVAIVDDESAEAVGDEAAADVAVVAFKNVVVDLDALVNDDDSAGLLALDAVTQGTHGTVVLVGNRVHYTPDEDFVGTDSFSYSILDADGKLSTATVTITIHGGTVADRRGGEFGEHGGFVATLADGTTVSDGADFSTIARGNYTIVVSDSSSETTDENPDGETGASEIAITVSEGLNDSWTYSETGTHVFGPAGAEPYGETGASGNWTYSFHASDSEDENAFSYDGGGSFATWDAGDLDELSIGGSATTGTWTSRDELTLNVEFDRTHDRALESVVTSLSMSGYGETTVTTDGTTTESESGSASGEGTSSTTNFSTSDVDVYDFEYHDATGTWHSVLTSSMNWSTNGSATDDLPGGQVVTTFGADGHETTVTDTTLGLAKDSSGAWETASGSSDITFTSTISTDYETSGSYSGDGSEFGSASGSGSGQGSASGDGETTTTLSGSVYGYGDTFDYVQTFSQARYDAATEEWELLSGTGSGYGYGTFSDYSRDEFSGTFTTDSDTEQSSGTFGGHETVVANGNYETHLRLETLDEEGENGETEEWKSSGTSYLYSHVSGTQATDGTSLTTTDTSASGSGYGSTSTTDATFHTDESWSVTTSQDLVHEEDDTVWTVLTTIHSDVDWNTTTSGTVTTLGQASGSGDPTTSTATLSSGDHGDVTTDVTIQQSRNSGSGLLSSIEVTTVDARIGWSSSLDGTSTVDDVESTFSSRDSGDLHDWSETTVHATERDVEGEEEGENEETEWFVPTVGIVSESSYEFRSEMSVSAPQTSDSGSVDYSESSSASGWSWSNDSITNSEDEGDVTTTTIVSTWYGYGDTSYESSIDSIYQPLETSLISSYSASGGSHESFDGNSTLVSHAPTDDGSTSGGGSASGESEATDVSLDSFETVNWVTWSDWSASSSNTPTFQGSGAGSAYGTAYSQSASGDSYGYGTDTTTIGLDVVTDPVTGLDGSTADLDSTSEYYLEWSSRYSMETESGDYDVHASGSGGGSVEEGYDTVDSHATTAEQADGTTRTISSGSTFTSDSVTTTHQHDRVTQAPRLGVLTDVTRIEVDSTASSETIDSIDVTTTFGESFDEGTGLWSSTTTEDSDISSNTIEFEQVTTTDVTLTNGFVHSEQSASGSSDFSLNSYSSSTETKQSDGSKTYTGNRNWSGSMDDDVTVTWLTDSTIVEDAGTIIYHDDGRQHSDTDVTFGGNAIREGASWTTTDEDTDVTIDYDGNWNTSTTFTLNPTAGGMTGTMTDASGGSMRGDSFSHSEYRDERAGDPSITSHGNSDDNLSWYQRSTVSVQIDDESESSYSKGDSYNGSSYDHGDWTSQVTESSSSLTGDSGSSTYQGHGWSDSDYVGYEDWSFSTDDPTTTAGRLWTVGSSDTTSNSHDNYRSNVTLTLDGVTESGDEGDEWEMLGGTMSGDGTSGFTHDATVNTDTARMVDASLRIAGSIITTVTADGDSNHEYASTWDTTAEAWDTSGTGASTSDQTVTTDYEASGSDSFANDPYGSGPYWQTTQSGRRYYEEHDLSTNSFHAEADLEYRDGWKVTNLFETTDSTGDSGHRMEVELHRATTRKTPHAGSGPGNVHDPLVGPGDGSWFDLEREIEVTNVSDSHSERNTATDENGDETYTGSGDSFSSVEIVTHSNTKQRVHVSAPLAHATGGRVDKETDSSTDGLSTDTTTESATYVVDAEGEFQFATGTHTASLDSTVTVRVKTTEELVGYLDSDLSGTWTTGSPATEFDDEMRLSGTGTQESLIRNDIGYLLVTTYDPNTGEWNAVGEAYDDSYVGTETRVSWNGSDDASSVGGDATTTTAVYRDRSYETSSYVRNEHDVDKDYVYDQDADEAERWRHTKTVDVTTTTSGNTFEWKKTDGTTSDSSSTGPLGGEASSHQEFFESLKETREETNRVSETTLFDPLGTEIHSGSENGSVHATGRKEKSGWHTSHTVTVTSDSYSTLTATRDEGSTHGAVDEYESTRSWERALTDGGFGSGDPGTIPVEPFNDVSGEKTLRVWDGTEYEIEWEPGYGGSAPTDTSSDVTYPPETYEEQVAHDGYYGDAFVDWTSTEHQKPIERDENSAYSQPLVETPPPEEEEGEPDGTPGDVNLDYMQDYSEFLQTIFPDLKPMEGVFADGGMQVHALQKGPAAQELEDAEEELAAAMAELAEMLGDIEQALLNLTPAEMQILVDLKIAEVIKGQGLFGTTQAIINWNGRKYRYVYRNAWTELPTAGVYNPGFVPVHHPAEWVLADSHPSSIPNSSIAQIGQIHDEMIIAQLNEVGLTILPGGSSAYWINEGEYVWAGVAFAQDVGEFVLVIGKFGKLGSAIGKITRIPLGPKFNPRVANALLLLSQGLPIGFNTVGAGGSLAQGEYDDAAVQALDVLFSSLGLKFSHSTFRKAQQRLRDAIDKARFAQTDYRETFSKQGREILSRVTGSPIKTIDDLANAIRTGKVKVEDLPVDYIMRDGNMLILNTRTSEALRRAGIARDKWRLVDRTGNDFFEQLLREQLERNGLDYEGFFFPTSSGP